MNPLHQKTLNEGNVELSKFPASKVRQMAKKLESSQATVKHMKKVTRDPETVWVNLLRHQRTELPPSKAQRKQFKKNKSRPKNMGYSNDEHYQAYYKKNDYENKKKFNPRQSLQSEDRCHKCGDSKHIEGFWCSVRIYQCRNCHKFVISAAYVTKNKSHTRRNQDHPKHTNWPVVDYLHLKVLYLVTLAIAHLVKKNHFCLQMKVKEKKPQSSVPAPKHFVTNFEFKVKPHKKKNQVSESQRLTHVQMSI